MLYQEHEFLEKNQWLSPTTLSSLLMVKSVMSWNFF